MTLDLSTSQVSLPSDSEVKVMRQFKAPLDLVYKAYTTPALMQRWLVGYAGWSMPVCEMDLRVGGQYRWRWRNNESEQEFGFTGVFREVIAGKKYVHTQVYDPGTFGGDMGEESIITVEFAEKNGHTILTCTLDYKTKESRDTAMSTGMTDGMETNYQLLDKLLTEKV